MKLVDMNNYCRLKMNASDYFGPRSLIQEINAMNANFLVWDDGRSNERRRKVFPDYKAKRSSPNDMEIETLNLFKHELKYYMNGTTVYAKDYEADDLIYTLSKLTTEEVTIISSDKDLTAIPNAKNPLVKEDWLNSVGGKEFVRLYKTLCGDPSDNIKGLSGFGKVSWEKLSVVDRSQLNGSFEAGHLLYLEDSKLASKIQANFEELKKYWEIVGFYEVPFDVWNLTKGKYSPADIERCLDEKGVL